MSLVNSSESDPCRRLEWDSRFFRSSIAEVARTEEQLPPAEAVRDWLIANPCDCVYLRVAAAELEQAHDFISQGFMPIDVRLTLDMDLLGLGPSDSAVTPMVCREALEEDMPALEGLAMQAHTDSRFFTDRRFDRQKARELYAVWLKRDHEEVGSKVWTQGPVGIPAGYVTCRPTMEAGVWNLGLVATVPSARGKGVATALIRHALTSACADGGERCTVITQGCNHAAVRLYERLGFRISRTEISLHRWIDS
jgi:ribosomal protein S18 acetylase RimI-like enzyme